MKKMIKLATVAWCMAAAASAQLTNVPFEEGRFTADWNSLNEWECPEWFKDAKFGLWAHWGPQCQAESGDWYARFMYYSDNPYDEHRGVHFNPSEYGLKEFCRDWVAAKWNPAAIMKKYADVGCKYFMALGNHHDNFDLWNSPYQEWNSVNLGPKRDLVGEWSEAARDNGLKFGVSIHASHAWTWLEPSQRYDGNLTKEEGKGKWWDGYDPQELYAQRHPHSSGWESSGTIHSQWEWGNGASIPTEAYRIKLQNRCRQVVNDYNPDMVYFDDTVLPFWGCDDQWGPDFLAHYYNHSANRNDGKVEVVVTGKILPDAQKEAMMWDVERGIPDRPQEKYWQTCTCIGDWHYKKSISGYKSAATVVRMLVDVVSKNGNLLLSIPLNADGEYDARELAVLDGIEAWMKINGESIYGTRYWAECFGEGPLAEAINGMTGQGFNEGQNYTSADVRYVTKGDDIYATIMAWPASGEYTLKAFSPLAESYRGEVEKVELLGYGEVAFKQGTFGLSVDVPAVRPNEIAPVFRISFKEEVPGDFQLLSAIVADLETYCKTLELSSSDVNTGHYSRTKVQALAEVVAEVKTVDGNDEEAVAVALGKLRMSYREFEKDGFNKGGMFMGTIEENLTRDVLVEADGFSGTLGGRYGKPDYWITENYSIDKGDEGIRNGLDNYGNRRGLSLGVWDDKESNEGDLTCTRIYRKVTLMPGTYYFGAAYNSLYGCNDMAYMFVSREICPTDELPNKSMACYQVNTAKQGEDLYGLYVEIEEEGEYYMGWQANLDNGSSQQEFRAIRVAFYGITELDLRPTAEKLTEKGWQKLDVIPEDMDFSQKYFALVERAKDLPLVARAHADNGKNWGDVYVMSYAENVDASKEQSAVWIIEAYDNNGDMAVGQNATNWIFSSMIEQNRQFRTEGWSKVVWQTYSDFGGKKGDNDSNRKLAYLLPEYSAGNGWMLKNVTSGAYIGPWDNGVFEAGGEFAANKSEADAAHFDLYTIDRSAWMQQYENMENASVGSPLSVTYLINNPSFERYDETGKPVGWVVEGEGEIEKGSLVGCDGYLYMNNWQGSGTLGDRSVSQTLHALPAGCYRLTVYSLCDRDGAWLFANGHKESMNNGGRTDTSLDFEIAEQDDVIVGVRLDNYQGSDLKYDNIRLDYLGRSGTTGIEEVRDTQVSQDDNIYDLSGCRLRDIPRKGLYIKGNKKYMIVH